MGELLGRVCSRSLTHQVESQTEKRRSEKCRYKCKEREEMRSERGATNCMVLSGCRGWGLVLTAKMEKFMEEKKGRGGGDSTVSL